QPQIMLSHDFLKSVGGNGRAGISFAKGRAVGAFSVNRTPAAEVNDVWTRPQLLDHIQQRKQRNEIRGEIRLEVQIRSNGRVLMSEIENCIKPARKCFASRRIA